MGGGLPEAVGVFVIVALAMWVVILLRANINGERERAGLRAELAHAEGYIKGFERHRSRPAPPPRRPPVSHRAPDPPRFERARTTGEIPVTRTEVLPVVKT